MYSVGQRIPLSWTLLCPFWNKETVFVVHNRRSSWGVRLDPFRDGYLPLKVSRLIVWTISSLS